jgi:hypothetical protein
MPSRSCLYRGTAGVKDVDVALISREKRRIPAHIPGCFTRLRIHRRVVAKLSPLRVKPA